MTGLSDILVFSALLLCVAAFGYFLVFYGNNHAKKDDRTEFSRLLSAVREMLNDYVSFTERHPGFNGKLADSAMGTTESIVNAIRECCSGVPGAREIVRELIEAYILEEVKPDKRDLQHLLNEDDPIVAFYELICVLSVEYGDYAFQKLWTCFLKNRVGGQREITEKDIFEAREHFRVKLNEHQKIKVLSEILYIYTAGLGAIDCLNWQKGCVEEIQLGLSGISKNLYDYRDELLKLEKTSEKKAYISSKDSVHAVIGGVSYRLSFISFGTEDELIRVLRNLARNSVSPELTRKNPMLVVDTKDNRRISVSRPPLTDAWVGLIRKFDTVSQVSLDELVKDEAARNIILEMLDKGTSIAVTGEMASGKTTLLRALLLKMGEKKSIRVIEADSFELNVREYLPDANTLTMRVSDEFTEERVMSFAKKTTGQIFAIGEITSPKTANLVINVSKYASTVLFTAHYKSTEDMVSDFTSARINAGGWNDETTAKEEALKALKYDIHVVNNSGIRKIGYINEVAENGSIRCLYRD